MNFVHLHTHSEYSILDGASKIPELVRRAADLGMPALGLTDHGSLGGIYEHYRECKKHGVKPIIGCEFYFAPGDARRKSQTFWGTEGQRSIDVSGSGSYLHLSVLARNSEGLYNLYGLQHYGFSEGFYRKPRIDFQTLMERKAGLTVLSGCMGGAIATRIRLGQLDDAVQLAQKFGEAFPGQFYIELMNHDNEVDKEINPVLIDIGWQLGLPLVLTNDSHYTSPEDSLAHEALCCLNTGRTLAEGSFFRDAGEGFHLRSYEEMEEARVSAGIPAEALSNTLTITEQIEDYSSAFSEYIKMPRIDVPDSNETLRTEAWRGLNTQFDGVVPEEYDLRLEYELDTITSLGYSDYFLVLADICREAKKREIRTNTRGSAAGSLVAFTLGIHGIDPIQHNLVFERFLNPSRASLPDIDLDIDAARRSELLHWIAGRYGQDFVALVGTYGYLKAKRAIDDATRVLSRPTTVAKALKAKIPPPKFGRSYDLDWKYFRDLEETEEEATLAEADFSEASDRDVVDLATRLEGTIRSEGIHAAGVIITPEPVARLLPVRRPANTNIWVTAFHNQNTDPQLDKLGFVKYDLLGLRNLGVLSECVSLLSEQSPGSQRDKLQLPETFDDPKTFELLSAGDTLGVFQLDSPGMRQLLRRLKPKNLNDIAAVLALYRPGPMGVHAHTRFADRKHTTIHPELGEALDPILGETYGLIVFQEQVLGVLKAVCGWDYAEADLVFNALRKKLTAKMEASKPAYDAAGKSRGFSNSALQALWDTLVPFADYSFNRAHATSYAIVAYQTAYLKANHGVQFMAVLLGSVADDQNRLPRYLEECSRMGIPVLPPDINISEEGFTVDGNAIRYGLSAIKGVGVQAYKSIVKQRPFTDLTDYLTRATGSASNGGVVRALCAGGALDTLAQNDLCTRSSILGSITELAQQGASLQTGAARGEVPVLPVTLRPLGNSVSIEDVQQAEKQALGAVVTQNPVILKLRRELDENEWHLVKKLIEGSPGNGTVSIEIPSGHRFVLNGTMTMTTKTRQSFEVLPLEVVDG